MNLNNKISGIFRKIGKRNIIITASVILFTSAAIVCICFALSHKRAASHAPADTPGFYSESESPIISASDGITAVKSPELHATATPVPENAKLIMTGLVYEDGEEYKYQYSDGTARLVDKDGRIIYYVKYDNGKVKSKYFSDKLTQYEYDAEGRIIKEIIYNNALDENLNGSVVRIRSYIYNSQHLVERIYTTDGDSDNETENIYFEYNENGILSRKREITERYETEYTYDASGKLLKRVQTESETGKVISQAEYKYDDSGVCTEISSMHYNGYRDMTSYQTEYPDSTGRTVHMYEQYDGIYDSSASFYSSYIYDENGALLLTDRESILDGEAGLHTYTLEGSADTISDVISDSSDIPVTEFDFIYNTDKKMYVFISPFDGSEIESGVYYEKAYDSYGKETSAAFYDECGNISFSRNTEYDIYGRKMLEAYSKNSLSDFTCRYEYDDNGKISRISYQRSGEAYDISRVDFIFKDGYLYQTVKGVNTNISYEYNDAGTFAAKTVIFQRDDSVCTIKFKYTDDDSYIEYISMNENAFKLNEKCQVIEKNVRGLSGDISNIYSFEYDYNGRLIKYLQKRADGNIEREYLYEYDDEGAQKSRTVILYDEKGSKISQKTYRHILRAADNEGEIYNDDGTLTELYGLTSDDITYNAEFEWIYFQSTDEDDDIDYNDNKNDNDNDTDNNNAYDSDEYNKYYLLFDPADLIP